MHTPYWYRLEDKLYSTCSISVSGSENYGSSMEVNLYCYPVISQTPKGVWLDLGFSGKRFVLRDAHKRWAAPTLDLAIESFRARKTKQISIYQNRIDRAKRALQRVDYQQWHEIKIPPAGH